MRFTKPKTVVGLDIGSHSVKAVQMSKHGGRLSVDEIGYALVDREQVNMDPVAAQASALREAIRRIPIHNSLVVGALPGQTVVIRYPRLRDIGPDGIDRAVQAEASQNIPYDLEDVFLDWSLLEEESDGDEKQLKVLLVAAKHEVIDTRIQVAEAAEIAYGMLSVDSLALADAAEGCQIFKPDETTALINVGASSVSIHFCKDGVSNFIRDISWGAKELIQAIAKARHLDYEKAEEVLFNIEEEFDRHTEETATVQAATDDDSSDEHVDVFELDEPETSAASLLDPIEGDSDVLGDDIFGDNSPQESALEDHSADSPPTDDYATDERGNDTVSMVEILSQPISRLVAEVRRSFDYYEHQLYERPVERIILSGGVAHISMLRDTLQEELGIDEVEVADPTQGGLQFRRRDGLGEFGQNPAKFMVAIGLAARGATEL